jgi:nucleoid DNA-binding protein
VTELAGRPFVHFIPFNRGSFMTPTDRKNTNEKPKAMSKSEILRVLAEETGLSRKQVASVFDGLEVLIHKSLGRRGSGLFVLPGVLKIKIQHKPATKARHGVNPFTGEPTVFKAKPARRVVKIQALKKLKDAV